MNIEPNWHPTARTAAGRAEIIGVVMAGARMGLIHRPENQPRAVVPRAGKALGTGYYSRPTSLAKIAKKYAPPIASAPQSQ